MSCLLSLRPRASRPGAGAAAIRAGGRGPGNRREVNFGPDRTGTVLHRAGAPGRAAGHSARTGTTVHKGMSRSGLQVQTASPTLRQPPAQ